MAATDPTDIISVFLSYTPSCIFSKPFIYYYIAFIAFKCKKEIYYDCQLYFILTKQKQHKKNIYGKE